MRTTINDRIMARATADRMTIAQNANIVEDVSEKLTDAIITPMLKRGFKPRRESIHLHTEECLPVGFNTFEFIAVWSPCAGELTQGPADGLAIAVPRDDVDGLPPKNLTLTIADMAYLHCMRAEAKLDLDAIRTVARRGDSNIGTRYERIGIDPINDIWIYEHRS